MQPEIIVPIRILAVSLLCPTGKDREALLSEPTSGEVPNFKARSMVPDRKSLKLMTQAVRLGVACIADVVSKVEKWSAVPPTRRGMYVGASPQVGSHDDLADAIDSAYKSGTFSIQDFGEFGVDRIHPLWLVRGLSNNVLGFSSAYHKAQGHNMSYAMGSDGGWNAILEGAQALIDNRIDIAVAGASDDLTIATNVLDVPTSQGAAFLVMERSDQPYHFIRSKYEEMVDGFGELGASKVPIGLALHEFSK